MAALIFTQYDQVYVLEFDATTSETHEAAAEISKHRMQKGVDITDNVVPEPLTVRIDGVITNTPLTRTVAEFFAAASDGKTPQVVGDSIFSKQDVTLAATHYRQRTQPSVSGGVVSGPPAAITNRPVLSSVFFVPLLGAIRTPVEATLGEVNTFKQITTVSTSALADAKSRLRICLEVLQGINRAAIPVKLVTEEKEYPYMLISSVSAVKNSAYDMMRFSLTLQEVNFASVITTKTKVKAKPLQKRAEAVKDAGQVAGFTPTGTQGAQDRSNLIDLTADRTTLPVPGAE